MKIELLEFNNINREILRGIFVSKNKDKKKVALMVGGFERSATTQKKFKILADNLNISSLRLDYTGIGLSDGDFSDLTVQNLATDIKSATEVLNEKGFLEVIVVCHSLSACAVSLIANCFNKIVLFAPALNQKELLRYWFVDSLEKEKEIDWGNYKQYLNEEEFLKDCKRDDKMTKANYISSNYFMEGEGKDYSFFFSKYQERILHIHGLNDKTVPINSNTIVFKNSVFIEGGDHDLERPDMIKQWLEKVIQFLD